MHPIVLFDAPMLLKIAVAAVSIATLVIFIAQWWRGGGP